MRRLRKGLLLLATLLVAAPTLAQQQPPARVGRVSIVEGTLAFYGPGDTDWSAAKLNFPVAESGWFATDPDSRAELRIGTASISLDNNTQAGFTALNQRAMQISVPQGRIDLHLRQLKKGQTTEVDIRRGAVWLMQPGIYEVESGGPDQPSRILVFEGSARFVGGGLDMSVKAGDALVLNGTDTLTANVEPVAPDEFTNWCRSHDYREERLAAPYHVSPAMTGFEELDSYGQWAAVPDYGDVWYPSSVASDWAPYREGHWAWVEPWGWNWVDDEAWGFAPFHYGRWARINDRWGWVPGSFVDEPVYAPALVAFVEPPPDYVVADAGPAVGWFPLAPGELYWPSYTRDRGYLRSVNITNVNVNVINNLARAAPARGAAPPQVMRQNFANRAAATVVPATVFAQAAKVAPAAMKLPPQTLQRTAISARPPPTIAPPPGVAATVPAPRRGVPPAPQRSTAAPAGNPPARPNFSHLAPAPQVARAPAQAAPGKPAEPHPVQATTAVPAPPTNAPGPHEQRPAEARIPPPAPGAHPGATQQSAEQATTTAPAPGRPPGPPDFSHLAPSRGAHPGQPGHATAPVAPIPEPHAGTAPSPQPETRTAPPGPAHPTGEPNSNQGPPPAPNHAAAPSGPAQNATEQRRAQQETIAREQAQQRAASQAAAQQQAQQRAASQAAAQQQAQQRAASQAAARQQAQQRAAAQAAAQQRAASQAAAQQQAQQRAASQAAAQQRAQQRAASQAAAQQQAQQRAASQAAAQQQAQQRAASQAAAQQQAQQRAASQAAAQQQAQQRAASQQQAQQKAAQQHGSSQPHCGHPNEPACPK